MTGTCVRCGRPTPDGNADPHCGVDRPTAQLAEIIDMTPAARDIATGQASRSGSGAGSGKPGSRLPLDLTATAKLDGSLAALTKWINHIHGVRGTTRPWFTHTGDPLIVAATWLPQHLEWMRHRPEVDEFLTDVEACARVVRGIARGPAEQKYLGPCGAAWSRADLTDAAGQLHAEQTDTVCDGDVYGRTGATTGTCRTCGAQVDQAERRAWLDAEVRNYAYRATEIEDAYGVNANTTRSWYARGQLTAHDHDQRGRPRFNLGDVLDLAAADAARRAEAQARRARREATREDAA